MNTNRVYNVAVIPGDGIGKEVVPEGVRVLEAAAKRFGFELRQDWFDFASYDYYAKHERMMPEDWKEKIGGHDAIFFGAVGWPEKIPDHISLWGSLILFRREFDQYVNLRPVRLMPGVPSPLANRKPGDIDFWVVRENTEGEYSSIGGRMFPGTEREIVMQETVLSRIGVDRVLKFAFELAQKTPKKHLTSATKSNGIAITMPYWDERVKEMAKNYPDVRWDQYHIDILTAQFVLNPDRFNVVVASNLFGDILSDLGPACTGTIGIAPGGNINPERKYPSVFEPVHGSAPDIAGQGIANPVGQIWSGAMMLEHLGETEAAAAIVTAIEKVLAEPKLRTRDLKGTADTIAAGKAIADALALSALVLARFLRRCPTTPPAGAESLSGSQQRSGWRVARRPRHGGMARRDRRRQFCAPVRQRPMRLREARQHGEVLARPEPFPQPLRFADPDFAEARPERLDQLHLIAVHDNALAQGVQLFRVRRRPILRHGAPDAPVAVAEGDRNLVETDAVERPARERIVGVIQGGVQPRTQRIRQRRRFGRILERFETAANCLKRAGREGCRSLSGGLRAHRVLLGRRGRAPVRGPVRALRCAPRGPRCRPTVAAAASARASASSPCGNRGPRRRR